MKKLVCLMLVALIGTVASAASMWFSGPSIMEINSSATISIIADVDVFVLSVGAITLTEGSAAPGKLNALINTLATNGTQRDGTVNNIWISKAIGTTQLGAPVPAGQPLYTFTIDTTGCDLGDVITISTWTGTDPFGGAPMYLRLNAVDTTMDSFIVTVPEPMTVALLGLGGLFIRRRK